MSEKSFRDVLREVSSQRQRQLDQLHDPENGSPIDRETLGGWFTIKVGEVATNVNAAVEMVSGGTRLVLDGLKRSRNSEIKPKTPRNAWLD